MQEEQEVQVEQEVEEKQEVQRRLKGRLVKPLQTFKQRHDMLVTAGQKCCDCLRVCAVAGSYSSAKKLSLCSRSPGNSMAALLC